MKPSTTVGRAILNAAEPRAWLPQWRLLLSLALKDLWHDRKISLCVAASLVAVIAPLLLLFGLKHGVVNQLQEQLLQDPRNLQVHMTGSGAYSPQWVSQLQQQPFTGFAIGLTRSLNTQADVLGAQGKFAPHAELIPTLPGDPLLDAGTRSLSVQEVVLSAAAAQRLDVKAGDSVSLIVMRRLEQREERGRWPVRVKAVLAPAKFERVAVLVHPDVLLQTEWFRDGFVIPQSGVLTGQAGLPQAPRFARARVYAKSIDHVAQLEQWLNAQNIETSSQLADIENVKAINHVLTMIFAVIGSAAVVGCAASMGGAFLANVDRKRRNLAVLRLMGFGRTAVVLQLVLQAMVLSLGGFVVGLVLYGLGSVLFNQLLGSSRQIQGFVCTITWQHAAAALLLAMLLSTLVSLVGAWRANHIHPAESLREI